MVPVGFMVGAIADTNNDKHDTLSAEYEGTVPPAAREAMRAARDDFDELFVLAEVPHWEFRAVARPFRDPLVLGYRAEMLFLVTSFDTTPLEEYVASEFTS